MVGARLACASVTKTAELFAVARSTVSKLMTAIQKEGKTLLKQNFGSCLIGTVGLLRGLLGRITKIQFRKLQQSLMTISRTQFPQNLLERCCTISNFTGEGCNQKTISK